MKRRRVPSLLYVLAPVAIASVLVPENARTWIAAGSLAALATVAAGSFARARELRAAEPSPFDALDEAGDVPVRPPADLKRLERMLGWRQYSREDFHHRVAPVLTRVLTSKLTARGVDPRAHPEAARRIAGRELHPLLHPPAADDGTIVGTAQIARMVDAIEAL